MCRKAIETVDELVAALGGSTEVGELLGLGRTAVEMWSTRGFIPNGWHLRLFLECGHRGLAVSPGLLDLPDDAFEHVKFVQHGAKPTRRYA